MPVINGVYTKDFPDLGRTPADADIIPIAEVANQITYKTTIGAIFNAKISGTSGRLTKFTGSNTVGNSILNEIGNAIHLTDGTSSYASFGIINPGTPGDPGVDNDCYIGSTINNDFTIRVNNTEAARFDTALRFKIANIQNAITDTDKFLVSDGGIVKYRTSTELLSDLGVAINTPITGDLLQIQSDGIWKNRSVASLGLVPQSRQLTINGTAYDLTADRSWSVGTITSLTGEATGSGTGAASVTLSNAAVTGKVLTGVNITGGSISATDSILTGFGKLQNQINGLIGSTIYQGTWNASTNTPTLASGVGTRGHYYIVSVAGSTNLDGITDWNIGDWAIFDGTAWQQVDNTDAVVSVNGQTGAVSLTTDNISEGATNLYFTNARSRAALSFAAGSGAYNSTTGVITIPTNTNQLTNGASFITLTSLSGSAPIQYNNTTGAISITQAGASSNGYLSSTDWNTFNNKQPAGSYVPTSRLLSINGTQYDLSADRSWSVGTVTSVAALTLGTSGTDLSSSVANGSITPVITLNVPTASAVNRGALSAADWSTFNTKVGGVTASSPLFSSGGQTPNITIQQASGSQNGYLSSTDWTTFNNKQASGNYITSLTGEATASGPGAAAVTLNNASVTGKVLTGVNITGGTVLATDTMLTAFGKLQNQINGLIGGSIYQGTWNASTNTPALASGVGTKGHYYIVSVAGTTNLDGITDWFVGDWAIFDGTAWQQVDNTDAVVTVNGYSGAVSLVTGDVLEGAGTLPGRPSQLYFTDARSRLALSFTAGSGAYDNTTGVITIPTNNNQITNGANYITLTGLSATTPLAYNNLTGAFTIQQANSSQNGYLSSTDWNTFNNKVSAATLAGYLPLTGGTLTGGLIGTTGAFTSSGSSDTFSITHSSGSGVGLRITKGGNGEGLYVNKTGGSGNAATIVGTLEATTLVKTGGLSSQFLKADGSVDSNTYATTSQLHNPVTLGTANGLSLSGQVLSLGLASSINNGALSSSDYISFSNKQNALTVSSPLSISTGPTPNIAIQVANTSQNGYLSSTDWNTFNNKATVSGVVTTNYIPKFLSNGNGFGTIVNSQIIDNGTNVLIGTTTDAGYKLDVNGTGRFNGSINVTSGGLLNLLGAKIGGDAGGTIDFNYNTGGTPSFTWWGGTTSSKFSVSSTGAATFSSSVTAGQGKFYSGSSSIPALIAGGAGGIGSTLQGEIRFGDAGNVFKIQGGQDYNAMNFLTNNEIRVTIKDAGNVGIGTTSPSAKLEVKEAIRIANPADANIRLNFGWTNSNQTAYIDAYNFSTGARPNLALQQDGGNVLIGTTTDNGAKLQVNGAITATSFIKSGGTSLQYLMADGSTKTNTQVGAGVTSGTLTFSGNGSQTNFDTGFVHSSTLFAYTNILVVTATSTEAGSRFYSLYLINQGGGLYTYGIVFSTAPASGTDNIKFNYFLQAETT